MFFPKGTRIHYTDDKGYIVGGGYVLESNRDSYKIVTWTSEVKSFQ